MTRTPTARRPMPRAVPIALMAALVAIALMGVLLPSASAAPTGPHFGPNVQVDRPPAYSAGAAEAEGSKTPIKAIATRAAIKAIGTARGIGRRAVGVRVMAVRSSDALVYRRLFNRRGTTIVIENETRRAQERQRPRSFLHRRRSPTPGATGEE